MIPNEKPGECPETAAYSSGFMLWDQSLTF